MSELLAHFISSFTAATISDAFLLVIICVLVISIYFSYHNIQRDFIDYAPNLLTSLGILGTFSGIVVGLMDFDPNNIDNSISLLLEGLKTAFITSLCGMLSSIILKTWLGYISQDDEEIVDVGPEQIYQVISKQSDLFQENISVTKELVGAIKGEEDSSLASQIKRLRIDNKDDNQRILDSMNKQSESFHQFQDKLWAELQHFGDLLSKSATEQVINALKEVIVDFNKHLTEQFGENFKRLDDSVKKLVEWQDNYRIQLQDMADKYRLGVEAISQTEESVAHISDKAESIPQSMEKLQEVMSLNHGQITDLEERLKAFNELRDKAIAAMPQIQSQLDLVMKQVSSSVDAASTHYSNMLEQSKQSVEDFNKVSIESADEIKTSLFSGAQEISKELNQSVISIGGKLAEASQAFESNASEATSNMKNMNNEVTSAAEKIRDELKDGLEDLNNIMRSLVTGIKDDAKVTSDTLRNANQQLVLDTQTIRDETLSAITNLQNKLEGSLQEVFALQAREIQRTFDSVEHVIKDTVSKTGSAVGSQVKYLDEEMQQEINRVIELMGRELATVTQQFTRDYTHLTNEMAKVISHARQGV
ncbi:hypothetical protein [Vibrio rarus]|uniref:hypothetical protein n=1 Tax=Vibrio rarus TaxID=413403 RepID=UPI0021C2AF1D|nr:hypothetical protein [Vibrio rarus]